jgi:lipoate-protein ligase A
MTIISKRSKTVTWSLVDSGVCDYDFNMAMDESLLALAAETTRPVLRFYGWTQTAASFGYFQRIAEVEQLTGLRPLVRRPTAGGIVPHDADWTYSVAVPTTDPWYGLKAIESYRRIHEWVQAALAWLGIQSALAPCCLKTGPGQCFLGYEQFDLLWNGRKIAGAAQRRTRHGLLIQGSLQPPPVPNLPSRQQWQEAMAVCGAGSYEIAWSSLSPETEFLKRVRELAWTKYSQDVYNRRR